MEDSNDENNIQSSEEPINEEISELGQSAGEASVGRLSRARKPPLRLKYEHMLTDDEYVDFADMFVANEPSSYVEAMKDSQQAKWHKAMEEEISALHERHTWDLVPPSEANQTLIECRWVFKLKPKTRGY